MPVKRLSYYEVVLSRSFDRWNIVLIFHFWASESVAVELPVSPVSLFRCQFCGKATVPFLTVNVIDYRAQPMMEHTSSQESVSHVKGQTSNFGEHAIMNYCHSIHISQCRLRIDQFLHAVFAWIKCAPSFSRFLLEHLLYFLFSHIQFC